MLKLWKNKSSNYGRGVYYVVTDSVAVCPYRLELLRGVVTGVIDDSGPAGTRLSVRIRRRHSYVEHVVPVEHAWGNYTEFMTEALDWMRSRRVDLARKIESYKTRLWRSKEDKKEYDDMSSYEDTVRYYLRQEEPVLAGLLKKAEAIETLRRHEQATLAYQLERAGNRVIGFGRQISERMAKGSLPSRVELEHELEQVEKLIELYSRKLTKAAGRKIKNIGPRKP